jgi:hypothetical protein
MSELTTFEPTPTQAAALNRRRAFRQLIETRAAAQKAKQERSVGIKGYYAVPEQVVQQATVMKPLPKSAPTIVWPTIPDPCADPTISQIQKSVVAHYGLEMSDMRSNRQTWDIAHPRQVAMYLAKTLTKHSLPQIGRRFGNRDHTTVLYSVKKIAKLMQTDAKLTSDINSILIKLTAATHVGSTDINSHAPVAEEDGHSSDRQDDSHRRGPDPSSPDHRSGARA